MIYRQGTNNQRINSSNHIGLLNHVSPLVRGNSVTARLRISLAVFAIPKSVANFPITMFRICDPRPLSQAFVDAKPRIVRTPKPIKQPQTTSVPRLVQAFCR